MPGLRLPLRSHAQVQLRTSVQQLTCYAPYVCCMNIHTNLSVSIQAGTGQGGRIERCAKGPGQPGHLSDHIWGDGAETRRPDNRSPLPAAWLCSPAAFWERCVNGRNCGQLIIKFIISITSSTFVDVLVMFFD